MIYTAFTKIPGNIMNQFSMDEYQGNFRITSTYREHNMQMSGVLFLTRQWYREVVMAQDVITKITVEHWLKLLRLKKFMPPVCRGKRDTWQRGAYSGSNATLSCTLPGVTTASNTKLWPSQAVCTSYAKHFLCSVKAIVPANENHRSRRGI